MNGYYVCSAESQALRGLSLLARAVYHALRERMDISSCTVGKYRPISYQMLSEECATEIPKGRGYQIVTPTRKELRTAIERLESADLLRRLAEDAPVFLLYQALIGNVRPKRTGPKQGQLDHIPSRGKQKDFQQTGPLHSPEPGTHLRSENALSTPPAAARSSSAVDNSPGRIAAGFLDLLSKRLGYPILHRHDDPRLAEWVESGLTFEALEVATLAAREARQRDNNPAPLNPGYIAAFLPDPNAWQQTWQGIVAKGQQLGITQQPGEQAQVFRARVLAAAEEASQESPQ